MERLGELVGDRSRLRQVLEFNCIPLAYMDASWWRPDWMPEAVLQRLRGSARARLRLSDFVRQRIDLPLILDFDYQSTLGRLALLSGGRLTRLVFWAGITRLSPWIAGVLRRSDIGEIKRRIGADGYDFALRSGRFVLRQARLGQPEALSIETSPGTIDEDCRAEGVRSLAAAFKGAPEPLLRRLQLKLPRPLVESHWPHAVENSANHLRFLALLERQIPDPAPDPT